MSPRSMVNTTGPSMSSPRWAGDYGSRDYIVAGGAKIVPAQFNGYDAVVVNVGAAGAAANAVAVPVDALSGPIPNGTVIWFSAGKFIKLNAAAAAGAVSLTTLAIPVALVDADIGTYAGVDVKYIPSGTIVGRSIAERDAGTGFGPAADTDDEFFLVVNDIRNADLLDDVELYRPGGTVYENFLPAFASASATVKAAIRSRYQCTIGQV